MSTGHSPGHGRQLAPLPENLFRAPIDFLIADHARIRRVCDGLDLLAHSEARQIDPEAAALALAFLEQDLPRHFRDEEDFLVPQLRRSWPAGGRAALERNLHSLQQQHRHDTSLSVRILPPLRRMAAGSPATTEREFSECCAALTVSLGRNLAWEEDAILRPAARYLSTRDLETLGRAMAARHGVAFPEFE
jgi:Hemerythrin HHE cation binding domain